MSVKWLQFMYDFFKDPPEWFEKICEVIGRIVFELLKTAGQEYIEQIKGKIMETKDLYTNSTGEEKFNIVWDFAHTLLPNWSESRIDTIVQNLYMLLKKNNQV